MFLLKQKVKVRRRLPPPSQAPTPPYSPPLRTPSAPALRESSDPTAGLHQAGAHPHGPRLGLGLVPVVYFGVCTESATAQRPPHCHAAVRRTQTTFLPRSKVLPLKASPLRPTGPFDSHIAVVGKKFPLIWGWCRPHPHPDQNGLRFPSTGAGEHSSA